jgi:hypothetical protein
MKRGGAGHPPSAWNRRAVQRASERSATLGRDCWEPENSSSNSAGLQEEQQSQLHLFLARLHLTEVSVHGARPLLCSNSRLPDQDQTRPDQTKPTPDIPSEGHEHPVMPKISPGEACPSCMGIRL